MIAAFFDMDRTLLSIDSGTSWMRWLYDRGELSRAGLARALWWSALYKAAVLDLETLATRLVADQAGKPEAEMLARSAVWHRERVDGTVAPAARRALAHHRERGDAIVLLTGSSQYAAEAVGRAVGIEDVLCSRLEVVDGHFTGRIAQRCFGAHKVALAEQFAATRGIDLARSWFYSDSYNDLPMLRRVGNAVAVNPDHRLRRHARRARWPVELWA